MAGHVRTVGTGKARRAGGGKPRKIRQHLPAGEVELARRRKQHLGARTVAADRIGRTRDPLRQLDIAREYVRSAAAKYTADPAVVDAAVNALLAAGDHIFTAGAPLPASAKRTRREAAARHRQQRQQDALLAREGAAAIRRQRTDARRAS